MIRFVMFSTWNFSHMRAISHACPYPCITGQWNANYPPYLSIWLIWDYSLQKHLTKVYFSTT